MANIRSYKELRVYQAAMDAAMRIFELSKRFPPEEKYSLTDQIRRCSRSVCSNIGEAWQKRRYPAHFVSKLSDSEGEADRQVGREVGAKVHQRRSDRRVRVRFGDWQALNGPHAGRRCWPLLGRSRLLAEFAFASVTGKH